MIVDEGNEDRREDDGDEDDSNSDSARANGMQPSPPPPPPPTRLDTVDVVVDDVEGGGLVLSSEEGEGLLTYGCAVAACGS